MNNPLPSQAESVVPLEDILTAFRRMDNDAQYSLMGAFRSLSNPATDEVVSALVDELFTMPNNIWPSKELCHQHLASSCQRGSFFIEREVA